MKKVFLRFIIAIKKAARRDTNSLEIELYRLSGCKIGDKCRIFSDLRVAEPFLISIGDNVTISTDVKLITHDNSIIKATHGNYTDLFGRIIIGKNVFIGSGVILLPGVTISDNTIIAAGSVVTKSVLKEGAIVAGNPARIIGESELFGKKNSEKAFNCSGKTRQERRQMILDNEQKLIKRKEM